MISYRDAVPDLSRPGDGPKGPLFTPISAHDPLSGPSRHKDPVAAMADDVREIVASRGCVEEMDLRQRGWRTAEIVEHLPDAIDMAQGREAVDAGRVPA